MRIIDSQVCPSLRVPAVYFDMFMCAGVCNNCMESIVCKEIWSASNTRTHMHIHLSLDTTCKSQYIGKTPVWDWKGKCNLWRLWSEDCVCHHILPVSESSPWIGTSEIIIPTHPHTRSLIYPKRHSSIPDSIVQQAVLSHHVDCTTRPRKWRDRALLFNECRAERSIHVKRM